MRIDLTPPVRARLSVVVAVAAWAGNCTMGDGRHDAESMTVDLGKDRRGRAVTLRLRPMEAASLLDAIQRAIVLRSQTYYTKRPSGGG